MVYFIQSGVPSVLVCALVGMALFSRTRRKNRLIQVEETNGSGNDEIESEVRDPSSSDNSPSQYGVETNAIDNPGPFKSTLSCCSEEQLSRGNPHSRSNVQQLGTFDPRSLSDVGVTPKVASAEAVESITTHLDSQTNDETQLHESRSYYLYDLLSGLRRAGMATVNPKHLFSQSSEEEQPLTRNGQPQTALQNTVWWFNQLSVVNGVGFLVAEVTKFANIAFGFLKRSTTKYFTKIQTGWSYLRSVFSDVILAGVELAEAAKIVTSSFFSRPSTVNLLHEWKQFCTSVKKTLQSCLNAVVSFVWSVGVATAEAMRAILRHWRNQPEMFNLFPILSSIESIVLAIARAFKFALISLCGLLPACLAATLSVLGAIAKAVKFALISLYGLLPTCLGALLSVLRLIVLSTAWVDKVLLRPLFSRQTNQSRNYRYQQPGRRVQEMQGSFLGPLLSLVGSLMMVVGEIVNFALGLLISRPNNNHHYNRNWQPRARMQMTRGPRQRSSFSGNDALVVIFIFFIFFILPSMKSNQ